MTPATRIALPVQIVLVTYASMYTAAKGNALEEVLTMAEHVTKEQVIGWYRPYGHTDEPIPFETLVSDLRDMKSADVAPVRHGRWEEASDGDGIVCPFCRTDFCTLIYDTEYFNYCPNCGAKMDGDKA